MNNKMHSYPKFYKTLPVLLFILTLYTALMPETARAYELSFFSSKSDSSVQDDFDKKFREGRDLMDKEDWAKAAEKFSALVAQYPNNKSTDAALYWLAFSQKKQKQYKEAGATIGRLIKDFPNSGWAVDGQTLNYQIIRPGALSPITSLNGNLAASGQNLGVATLNGEQNFRGFTPFGVMDVVPTAKVTLDREDEIKLAAFQSLLSADLSKGIAVMSEILAPGSKASENLKIGIIRAARRSFGSSRLYYTDYALATVPGLASGSQKQLDAAQLREPLVRIYQSEPNIKIRKEIIYTLSASKDDESVAYLGRLYNSESDREVKKAIINGLGSSGGLFNGIYNFTPATVNGLAVASSASAPATVTGQGTTATATGRSTATAQQSDLFTVNNVRTAQGRSINTDNKPRPEGAEAKLLREIAKTEKDNELRRLAYSNLLRMNITDMVGLTIQVYDSESDENYRQSLIQTLGRLKATSKLIDIAKNDKSDKLRLEAISALRNNNSPEAIKFLEDLIR